MNAEQVQQQKKQFRKRIQEALKTLTTADVERQSADITSKALSLPEYRKAKTISIFLAMPGKEVSTLSIVRQAFKDGKEVYVPYIHASKDDPKSKIMDMLRLQDEDDLVSLKPDPWGIPSLPKESIGKRSNALGGVGCLEDIDDSYRGLASLDLIFMPSMAFDTFRNRLGHGKGFYDRYITLCESLSSHRQDRKVPQLVGLALREQILPPGETLPVSEHDWKVDRVITSGD